VLDDVRASGIDEGGSERGIREGGGAKGRGGGGKCYRGGYGKRRGGGRGGAREEVGMKKNFGGYISTSEAATPRSKVLRTHGDSAKKLLGKRQN